MEKLRLTTLRDQFNREIGAVRLVALMSPTWPVCQYGQGVVRGLFEEFADANLRGFVVWVPVLDGDNEGAARVESEALRNCPVTCGWDADSRVSLIFARALHLTGVAWDTYLLYGSGVSWTEEEPPKPTFWMHQLPTQAGAANNLLLQPGRFAEELLGLLGRKRFEVQDLAFRLHTKGLMKVKEDTAPVSLTDITRATGISR